MEFLCCSKNLKLRNHFHERESERNKRAHNREGENVREKEVIS